VRGKTEEARRLYPFSRSSYHLAGIFFRGTGTGSRSTSKSENVNLVSLLRSGERLRGAPELEDTQGSSS